MLDFDEISELNFIQPVNLEQDDYFSRIPAYEEKKRYDHVVTAGKYQLQTNQPTDFPINLMYLGPTSSSTFDSLISVIDSLIEDKEYFLMMEGTDDFGEQIKHLKVKQRCLYDLKEYYQKYHPISKSNFRQLQSKH